MIRLLPTLVMVLVIVAGSPSSGALATEPVSGWGPGETVDPDTITDELTDPSLRAAFEIIAGRVPCHGPAWTERQAAAGGDPLELVWLFARQGNMEAARSTLDGFRPSPAQAVNPRLLARARVALGIAEGTPPAVIRDDVEAIRRHASTGGALSPPLAAWFDLLMKWLQWQAAVGDAEITTSMLGTPLDQPDPASDATFDELQRLLTDFPEAAEPMRLFGDLLRARGHLNLAAYAWLRAQQLDHPTDDAIRLRLDAVWSAWTAAAEARGGLLIEDRERAMREMNAELITAHEWLRMLHKYERKAIERGDAGDFESLEEDLEAVKVERRWPREHGLRTTTTTVIGNVILTIGWTLGALMVLAIIVVTIRRGGSADPPNIHTAVNG